MASHLRPRGRGTPGPGREMISPRIRTSRSQRGPRLQGKGCVTQRQCHRPRARAAALGSCRRGSPWVPQGCLVMGYVREGVRSSGQWPWRVSRGREEDRPAMPGECCWGQSTARQLEAVDDGQQGSGDATGVNPVGNKVYLLSTPKAKPPRAIPIALPLSKSSV